MVRLSSLEEQVAAQKVAGATALTLLHEQRQELAKQQATVAFLEQKNAHLEQKIAFLEQQVEHIAARLAHSEGRVTLVGNVQPLRRSNSEGAFARACSIVTSVVPFRR